MFQRFSNVELSEHTTSPPPVACSLQACSAWCLLLLLRHSRWSRAHIHTQVTVGLDRLKIARAGSNSRISLGRRTARRSSRTEEKTTSTQTCTHTGFTGEPNETGREAQSERGEKTGLVEPPKIARSLGRIPARTDETNPHARTENDPPTTTYYRELKHHPG